MTNFIVPAHASDEFESFDPGFSHIFEETEIEVIVELPDLNKESYLDGYVEEEDEDFEFSESESLR